MSTPPIVFALVVVFTPTSTAWADCAPNAAILAGTTYPIANVPNAAHLPASISRPVVVLCAGRMDSLERAQQQTRTRLPKSLKLASETLQANICKLEKTGAHPLLIAARKKELAKIQGEIAKLRLGRA